MAMWQSNHCLGKNVVQSTGQKKKELQESMNRCIGRRNINETLLKMALNTIQSINQSVFRKKTQNRFKSLSLCPD